MMLFTNPFIKSEYWFPSGVNKIWGYKESFLQMLHPCITCSPYCQSSHLPFGSLKHCGGLFCILLFRNMCWVSHICQASCLSFRNSSLRVRGRFWNWNMIKAVDLKVWSLDHIASPGDLLDANSCLPTQT